MVARRHWFLAFIILLAIWIGTNMLSGNGYEATLRPFVWLIEQIGYNIR